MITINSAKISNSGAISVTYTLTDPSGLPLDAAGVTTPGVVSLAYVASYIPKGQAQYVAYTTSKATGKVLGTITRPDFELGGTPKSLGPGQYQYTFQAQAPAGFDPTVTTTVAVDGNRDLTAFNLGTSYAGTTFNFVPNGVAGYRHARCHPHRRAATPATTNWRSMAAMPTAWRCASSATSRKTPIRSPATRWMLKVFSHKIHMGSQLPSVVGTATTPGVPYRGCRLHELRQQLFYGDRSRRSPPLRSLPQPNHRRRASQSFPDATRAGQPAAPATTTSISPPAPTTPADSRRMTTECHNCHIPQGELPFDASILGAHVVPTDTAATYPQNPDTLLAGINLAITSVTNTSAGQTPTVNFTLQDDKGNNIPLSQTSTLQFTMAGPTTDYGYTSFGSDTASTPGYVTESASKAACSSAASCTYTFTHAIPAAATGTYAIGGEARENVTVLAGTTTQQTVEAGAKNPVVNFSVDGSAVAPRRTVVALSNCNNCHVALSLHGNLRNNTEYCVLCHNPSNTDASRAPTRRSRPTKRFRHRASISICWCIAFTTA